MKNLILLISIVLLPFTAVAQDMCEGDFDLDGDQDGSDAALFKSDFGRSDFSEPCPPDSPSPITKTGQTSSYATGDDAYYQNGLDWSNPRFTDNEDGTVIDNWTRLTWMKNANCFGLRNWYQALPDCNALADGQCGLIDGSIVSEWRLPNVREIESLRDYGQDHPILPVGHPFINIPGSGTRYWSSSTWLPSDEYAIWVGMNGGAMDGDLKASTDHYVWCVRGGQ